jgi:PAS domain S-box-containing protein
VDVADEPSRETLARLAESGYQQMLDAIADMILVKGPRSRIVWANKAFRDVYGMTNEELRGAIDSPTSEPDYTQKFVQDDQRVFETGETLDIPDEPVKSYDGSIRSYHTVKSAILDAMGKVVMTVGVSREITERKLTFIMTLPLRPTAMVGANTGKVSVPLSV